MNRPYFAYGSNTHPTRLTSRVASAKRRCPATLHAYSFGWARRPDGTVRATVRSSSGSTRGVLFDGVPPAALDRFEGEGTYYERINVTVATDAGPVEAFTYIAILDEPVAGPSPTDAHYAAWVSSGRAMVGAPTSGVSLVAVYGSLRKGFGNHEWFLKKPDDFAVPCGETTLAGFALYDLGAFPGAVYAAGETIRCEVYAVGPATLAALDRLEGHPSFYRREQIESLSGATMETYVYRGDTDRRALVPGGDWSEHKLTPQAELTF